MIAAAGTLAVVASKRTIELSVPFVESPVVVSLSVRVPAPFIVPVAFKPMTPGSVTVRPMAIANVSEAPTVKVPLIVKSLPPAGTLIVVPEIVRLLNVVAAEPVILLLEPVMVTVPLLWVKAALLVKSFPTVRVALNGAVSVPLLIRRLPEMVVVPDIVTVPAIVTLFRVLPLLVNVPLPFMFNNPPDWLKLPALVKLPATFSVEAPAVNVALAKIDKVFATVIDGVVPPNVVVNVVVPSPMVRPPRVIVPTVPTHDAPLEPIQFAPAALLNIVVVEPEVCVKLCPLATLILPELAAPVEPTVKVFAAMANVPAVTVRFSSATIAAWAVYVPAEPFWIIVAKLPFGVIVNPEPVAVNVVVWVADFVKLPVNVASPPMLKAFAPIAKVAVDCTKTSPSGLPEVLAAAVVTVPPGVYVSPVFTTNSFPASTDKLFEFAVKNKFVASSSLS